MCGDKDVAHAYAGVNLMPIDSETKFLINRMDRLERKLSRQIEDIDKRLDPIIEFKNKEDAEWFENEIVYPEGTMEKSPLKHVMKMSEESKKFAKPFFEHTYTFEVKNNDQLMDKLHKTR